MQKFNHPSTPDFHLTAMNRSTTPAAPSRRRFISLMGGGAVFAAAGTAACSSGYPDVAVQPWREAALQTDLRRHMLAHALLAPNPHNRQPWRADLSREGEITFSLDANRLLPETDPYGRQIVIGCGAFIELAVIAAAERGHAVTVQAFPQGAPADGLLPGALPLARLVIGAAGSAPRDPLFAAITQRHTHKGAYDSSRTLPAALPPQWLAGARSKGLQTGVVSDAPTISTLRTLARQAWEQEMTTPRTWLESARLLRIGPNAVAQHRDGISVMDTVPRLLHKVGAFDPLQVPTRGSANFDRVMQRWATFESGSGFYWLTSAGNSRAQQLDSGRTYVRAQLQATLLGVHMHPLSQALQEFAEVREQRSALHQALGLGLGLDAAQTTLQMFARVGYGVAAAAPTPRRGLPDLLAA